MRLSLSLFILREVDIFLCFTWRDWSATFIPGAIFALGAVEGLSLPTIVKDYTFLVLWIAHFLYFFNLTNQITGVVEDSVNKIDRSIPSGKVTLTEAKIRLVFVFVSYLLITAYNPTVFIEMIISILTTAFACLTTAGNHWFGKNNVAMTAAMWSLFSASWKSFAPHTHRSMMWVYGMAIRTGIMMHIQDMRDTEGDKAAGRKILSIVLGDWEARAIIAFVITPTSMVILHISNRAMTRGYRYDHKTYMYFTYFHCGILAMIAFEGTNFMDGNPVGTR